MTTVGFSMELESGALTRLEGPEVGTACLFGEAVYLANDTGLFKVGGDTDDGVAIAVRMRLPATDMGLPGPKRLPAVALEGLVGGRVEVAAVSESGSCIEGETVAGDDTGLPGRTVVRLDRGHGRFWQVALELAEGGAFDVGALVLMPLDLDRRAL